MTVAYKSNNDIFDNCQYNFVPRNNSRTHCKKVNLRVHEIFSYLRAGIAVAECF